MSSAAQLKPFGATVENQSARCPWAIFPRKRLDINYSEVLPAIQSCLTLRESQRKTYEEKFAQLWNSHTKANGKSGHVMVALSVRTAFDLLLQTLHLPPGSQVLCSAITIPDMLHLLRHHELVPVPVDLHFDTLDMDMEKLEQAITEQTRAILVAHVFGTRVPMDQVVAFARKNNLLVVEDCAQAFIGLEYTGHPDVDVSMFSFGTIKTSTAFGGALVRVQSQTIYDEMKRRESRYPTRSNGFFFKRLVKYGFLHGLSTPAIYGILLHLCALLNASHDSVITSAIRGFSGGDLVNLIRHRPSVPLLGLLYERLARFNGNYVSLRRLKSEMLLRLLHQRLPMVRVPGCKAPCHYYWLFPIIVASPQTVIKRLNQEGFDVTAGATQLAYVPSPAGQEKDPKTAKFIMQNLVYLPVTAEMPEWAIEKMVKCLVDCMPHSAL